MSQMIHPSKMELRLSCLLPPKFYSSRRNQKPHSAHMKALLLKWAIYWTIDYTIYALVTIVTKATLNLHYDVLLSETSDWAIFSSSYRNKSQIQSNL